MRDWAWLNGYRHGKMRDLRNPGSRKYLIVEEFTIYAENVSIYSLKWAYKSQISILEMQNFIRWLIRTWIFAIGSIWVPFCHKLLQKFVMINGQVWETKQRFLCLYGWNWMQSHKIGQNNIYDWKIFLIWKMVNFAHLMNISKIKDINIPN